MHNLIHEFLINMAFIMACPNFKKGLKMAFGPLGVKPTHCSSLLGVRFSRIKLTKVLWSQNQCSLIGL
jgi:hypothetical protein